MNMLVNGRWRGARQRLLQCVQGHGNAPYMYRPAWVPQAAVLTGAAAPQHRFLLPGMCTGELHFTRLVEPAACLSCHYTVQSNHADIAQAGMHAHPVRAKAAGWDVEQP